MTATKQAVSTHIYLSTRAVTSHAHTLCCTGECAAGWMEYPRQQANSPAIAAHDIHPGWYRKMGPAYLKMG